MRTLTLGERLKNADWILLGLGLLLAFVGVVAVQVAESGEIALNAPGDGRQPGLVEAQDQPPVVT